MELNAVLESSPFFRATGFVATWNAVAVCPIDTESATEYNSDHRGRP